MKHVFDIAIIGGGINGTGIARDAAGRGLSVLLVEHDMGFVMDLADRIVVLDFGTKIAEGMPQAIKTNPDVIKAYLGAIA